MIRNGIAVDRVGAYVEMMRADPRAGVLSGRSSHHWDGGYAVGWRSTELSVGGQTIIRDHTLSIDLPKELGGDDGGPTPGEILCAALGACIAQQFVEHAALRGVDLDHLEVDCAADGDIRGMFGIGDVRPGFNGISISLRVRSDADDDVVDELLQNAVRTSPIADSVGNPVPIQPELQRV